MRATLGENATALYGFEPRELAPIAASSGPTLASFACEPGSRGDA